MSPGLMTQSQQPLTKQEILTPDSRYSKALQSLITEQVRQEDPEQTQVFAKIRRNNLYYRGKQFLTLVRSSDGVFVDYRPLQDGMQMFSGPDRSRDEMYDNILPLFRGDVRKWCGVLGVRAPNAKCEPRTVGNDEQIRLSRIGDRAISYLRNSWRADDLQRYLAYSLAINGTTFGFVSFVANPDKYGVTEIPRLETVQVPTEEYFDCYRCGTKNPIGAVQEMGRCARCESVLGPEDFRRETVPGVVQTGVEQYANGAVELQLASGATVKTPYSIVDLEHCPWLWYEYLVNRYTLIRTYAPLPAQDDRSPEAQFQRELREHLISDKTTQSFGASSAEVTRTLNTMSSPSGVPYPRKSLASFAQYFLDPSMMEALPKDDSGELRERLLAEYPRGCHLVYINGKLADIRKAIIPQRWSICQPDAGEYIWRDAVFDDYVQGMDVINDSLNLVIQQAEKSTPLTFFDPDIVDPDYLRDRQVQTGEMLEAKRGVGSQLSQSFFRIPPAELNKSLIDFIEFYILKNRENVGIMPAIYGGGAADEAVGVAKIRRNQSLMQLNIPWNYMRDFWEQTYENGIRLLAEYSNGKLYTAKAGAVDVEELDGIWELSKGGIRVECEEAMPMSWAQRQEQVESMLDRNPQSWTMLGLTDMNGAPLPANVETLQEAVGLPDWQVPGLAARERLLDIVNQLVQSDPIDPPPMLAQPGMPPAPPAPPQPSIQPNTTIFDAPFAVSVLRDWLQSDKGRDAEQGILPNQSPRGFENVLVYTDAWMQLAAPPPLPPPPGDDAGGQGEEPLPDQQAPVDQRGVSAPAPPGSMGVAQAPPPGAVPQPQAPGAMIQ